MTSSFPDVYRRIQLALNTRTQGELASILEIRQSSISDAKRRDTIPSGWYLTLFEKCGLNQDWLRYGTGPMYLRTEQGYVPQEVPVAGTREDPSHYSDPAVKSRIVTVYSMHCKPNESERVPELKAAGKLVLPSNFAGPETLVLRMQSNNMAPTVRNGAYIGVNTADTQPLSGGVFVLKDDHMGLLVRRVFLDCSTTASYVLRSDDDQHPESTLQPEEFAERIMGRVSWVIQEVA